MKDYRDKFNWVNMNKGAKDWTTKINKFTIKKADGSKQKIQSG